MPIDIPGWVERQPNLGNMYLEQAIRMRQMASQAPIDRMNALKVQEAQRQQAAEADYRMRLSGLDYSDPNKLNVAPMINAALQSGNTGQIGPLSQLAAATKSPGLSNDFLETIQAENQADSRVKTLEEKKRSLSESNPNFKQMTGLYDAEISKAAQQRDWIRSHIEKTNQPPGSNRAPTPTEIAAGITGTADPLKLVPQYGQAGARAEYRKIRDENKDLIQKTSRDIYGNETTTWERRSSMETAPAAVKISTQATKDAQELSDYAVKYELPLVDQAAYRIADTIEKKGKGLGGIGGLKNWGEMGKVLVSGGEQRNFTQDIQSILNPRILKFTGTASTLTETQRQRLEQGLTVFDSPQQFVHWFNNSYLPAERKNRLLMANTRNPEAVKMAESDVKVGTIYTKPVWSKFTDQESKGKGGQSNKDRLKALLK